MVIFTIGGVIGGVILGTASYDDYSDHSDYSNYSDYSDYAERKQKEKEAKISSLQGEKASIESMLVNAKSNIINGYLNNSSLANASASDLASERKLSELNNYVLNNIQQEETNAINEKIKDLKNEIVNIDNAISELENIKNNMKK